MLNRKIPALLSAMICLAGLGLTQSSELEKILSRDIIGSHQAMAEVQAYAAARVIPMPAFRNAAQWERYANRMRRDILERVVLRGEALSWNEASARVDWLETIPGGPGYRIKKLRYEALPGLWIPALLYEPENLSGKVPVILNVNGHERQGKAVAYKQIRCINQAKRGMLALNVEWFNMGQLRAEDFDHYRMNQLDLCGTSGIAVHYLYLKRALDLLLSLEHADPERLAVTGLSGGGWQTIFISALDTRVKLANPVAGYSSYLTRARFLPDLGDSEQTPSDLAAVTDYDHLTALMAPRPTLLTYNAVDNCCFRADYALASLLDAARPIFSLYDRPGFLRHHVNLDPGTHNYERDNREHFYRMLGDFFYSADKDFHWQEISSDSEVKTAEQLQVDLPAENADFHKLAVNLSRELPRHPELPQQKDEILRWQRYKRNQLRQVVQAKHYDVQAEIAGRMESGETKVTYWRLELDKTWTVPAVELAPHAFKSTTILVADSGRAKAAAEIDQLLKQGRRVVAVDPFYFGESRIERLDFLFALLVAALGDRPLGIQASQMAAIARWLAAEQSAGPIQLAAIGPRASLFSLVAAALEQEAISELRLYDSFASLKEIIEQNRTVKETPELFCFGLLEQFDIKQLMALTAPRRVNFINPSTRAKAELSSLKDFYALLGVNFNPL